MAIKIHNLNLHLDAQDHWLYIHVNGGRLGVGSDTAKMPVECLMELSKLGDRLVSDRSGGHHSRKEGEVAGTKIFQALFGAGTHLNPVGAIFEAATEKVEREGHLLRISIEYKLHIDSDETRAVHEVPWELMFHPKRGRFVVLDEAYLLVRHLRGTGDIWRPLTASPRILLTAACPQGVDHLNLESEIRQIESVLNWTGQSLRVRKVKLQNISAARLNQEFNRADNDDQPFHMWHHCGHARSSEGVGRLVLHAEDGVAESAAKYSDPSLLPDIVMRHPELRLVVLNVCLGGDRRGLATLLAALKVPAVIGFRTSIDDHVALGFADALWRRLPRLSVDLAVRGARRSLSATSSPLDFAKIIIFLRQIEGDCLLFN